MRTTNNHFFNTKSAPGKGSGIHIGAVATAAVFLALLGAGTPAVAQRVLGIDVSAWQGNLNTVTWNTLKRPVSEGGDGRDFVMIRSSRGGTTGYYNQSDPDNLNGQNTLSQRYDDPYFVQNITLSTAAGMFAGAYHFDRADIVASTPNAGGIANTGTDEADHFIQMAGPWMRPGYLLPMFDLEAGANRSTAELSTFATDFSDRLYQQMGIRPLVYVNSWYANSELNSSVATSMPNLWIARPSAGDPLTTEPPPPGSYPNVYGVWNPSYPTIPEPQPWKFWQYDTGPGLVGYGGNIDKDVAHGGMEYLKDYLVPALWMNNSSGQWTDLTNWNSGQTPVAPVQGPGQVARVGPMTLPTPRLPYTNDTVILDRTGASITVTLASGTHNIRKLYMRETLNLTGGSLAINYVPSSDSTPISAQFSGPVTLSGSGSLSVHTLQVDALRTFTVSGGTFTFNTLNLMPNSTTPGKLAIGGDVTFNALAGANATITNGTGSGSPGWIDLGGAMRGLGVGGGADVFVKVAVSNGGITKSGSGTLHLDKANNYTGGTLISAGVLEGGVSASIPGNVTNNSGTLKLDTTSVMASSATLTLASSPAAGAVNLNFAGTQTINSLYFGTVKQMAGTWGASGSGASHQSAAFTGSGILNVTTGPVASSTALSRTDGSSPSAYGDSLTFTATVTGTSPGGTVQFKVDGVAAGSPVTLVGGAAAFVTTTLSASGSPHQITAFYSGDAVNFPSDTSASPLSQVINPKILTAVLISTISKSYDGTADATLSPGNYSLPGVLSGDVVTLSNPTSGTYDTRNAGTGKIVTATGLVISGSSVANYALSSTSASGAIGTINKRSLRLTAVANTKTYDGTTSAAATPTQTGVIQTGDSAPTWTETYDTKNVGTGKTLTPAGIVSDGNGGANYNMQYVNNTSGVISKTNLTVTAVPNSKPYDGTTIAATAPTLTGSIQTGDSVTWTVTYDTKNVGTGKTLTPAGTVSDGNGGANYNVTFFNSTGGTIAKTNLSVTAGPNTKAYDGTTTAAATPILAGSVQIGDTATWTQTYDTKHVGTGKTLTVTGTVDDGNGGANYNITFYSSADSTITKTNLTVTAAPDTKIYDGTTSAAATPTVTAGSLQPGDSATWTETYDTKHAGTGKTLTPTGTVSDGNGGANYAVQFSSNTNGSISQTNLTVTAAPDTKIYDGTTSAAATPTLTAGTIQAGDSAPTWTETYDTKNAGTGKTLTPAGTVNDGNGGANYNVMFAGIPSGIISQTNLTVTATPNTKAYDGTTSAAATPTVTAGSLQVSDSATWTETYDTKNVGAGKPLTPAGTVTDGNGGANYNVTFANSSSGVITALATSCSLVSSVNPSGPGNSVMFTAAVSGVPPAADHPTGDVVFSANDTPFATNALAGGSASASSASLPLGTNAITALYLGDGNLLSSTGGLSQEVKAFVVTCSQTNALLSIADNLNGTFTLTFVGTPQAEYYLSASTEAAPTSWAPVAGSTNTVTDASGLWQFTVTNTAPQQFYRGTAVVPCP